MDLAKLFIMWGPTFLFCLLIFIGIIIGLIRGFRKSLILFIHMFVVGIGCFILYMCLINDSNLDANIVNFINSILTKFDSDASLQNLLSVSEEEATLTGMLMTKILSSLSTEDITYWFIYDNFAYISTIVDMCYHIILAIICLIFYLLLIFILYIIYLLFYPVRRKVEKINKKYRAGEIPNPYKKRRLLGGLVGGIRSCIVGVIIFSFLGSLIYIGTGNETIKNRNELEGSQEFTNSTWNEYYDYYSYVCQISDTGIFKILNSIKDTDNTPYYFYFADLVLQGNINDDNLGVNDKFYLRDEIGEYTGFVNKIANLFFEYGGIDIINDTTKIDSEQQTEILLNVLQNEEFVLEFEKIIDEFEGKPFFSNLCLASLTSLVNHIDLIESSEDEENALVGIVNSVFKGEDAIKVSDLATENDIKSLFKGMINLVANFDYSVDESLSEEEQNIEIVKKSILIARDFIPVIQDLSLFSTRADVGNKIISNVYSYVSSQMTLEDVVLDIPSDINWIDEFNILLDSCKSLLTITSVIYTSNEQQLTDNLLNMFEGPEASLIETEYDILTEKISSSKILDIVFKSSYVGKAIDDLVVNISGDSTASIPSDINYSGSDGECAILLKSLKLSLKNGAGTVLSNMMDKDIDSSQIKEMINLMTKEIVDDSGNSTNIIKTLTESKLLYYMISVYLMHCDFGSFELYIPDSSIEIIDNCKVIKRSEIDVIVDLLSNCVNLIVEIIDNPENIDYAKVLSDNYIKTTTKESLLLQGTLANLIINISSESEVIILPAGYDVPDAWLSGVETGEIIKLLDVVFEVANITIDDNKYLINELLNGCIEASIILDLEEDVIKQLCSSKVLQYTISDKVTDLGTDSFKIVVARNELEEVNALTTTSKTINVIKSNELYKIFIEIKKIVTFENDTLKINYNNIFENKEELSKSKTITATIVQLLIDNTDSGFIVIPQKYQEDFEKIKTDEQLIGNVWFGDESTSKDDELYLMLSGIETLIDKDDNGKIPNDFDFDNIQNNLKIKKNGIDEICSSAILNASVSKQIINTFCVEKSLYSNDIIERNELDKFFNSVFAMFNSEEIIVNDLQTNMFDLEFTKESTSHILDSIILTSTISDAILSTNGIYVPIDETTKLEFVERQSGRTIKSSELDSLFNALFSLLGDNIKINNINADLTNTSIKKSDVNYIATSHILRAIISYNLLENNDIIILNDAATNKENMTNSIEFNTIDKVEIINLLNSMFVLTDDEILSIDQITTHFSDLSITDTMVESILKSNILKSTIGSKITKMNEIKIFDNDIISTLDVKNNSVNVISDSELENLFNSLFRLVGSPISINNINNCFNDIGIASSDIEVIFESNIINTNITSKLIDNNQIIIPDDIDHLYDSNSNYKLDKLELKNLFNSLLSLFDKSNDEKLYINEITLNSVSFNQEKIDSIVSSKILSTTLSEKFINENSLTVPSIVIENIKNIGDNENKYRISNDEFKVFLIALFSRTNNINSDNFSLENISLPTNIDDAKILTNSLILSATLSNNISDESSNILVPDELIVKYVYKNSVSDNNYIIQDELTKLIVALAIGLNKINPTQLTISDIIIPESLESRKALVASEIIRTTISEKVLNQAGIAANSDNIDISKHIDGINIGILSETEIINIIDGISKLSNDNDFNNISLDVEEILEKSNKEEILRAIGNSDVYRYVISNTLNEEKVQGVKAYQLFRFVNSSILIDNTYTYYYTNVLDKYIINFPESETLVYNSFNLTTDNKFLFTYYDIMALNGDLLTVYQ